MKLKIKIFVIYPLIGLFLIPLTSFAGNCDYPWQRDSAGRKCGGRAASVRPGGRLGGDGTYTDSYGRKRIYGRDNDPYDKPSYPNNKKGFPLSRD